MGYYVLNTYDENVHLTRVDDQEGRLVLVLYSNRGWWYHLSTPVCEDK
ncbi:MAG: hypothetical protein KBB20_01050 [Bacteroidales bacterium]|nr:hypothetical protein [Bacteroidales bacterium]MDI9544730.1 hypothetical protein [Bacteroidota bacterium]HNZ80608.1 hypothetical protein [Bacteroidales bacterium]HPB35564.1 hypothetical protein [Bacteroidales bacterium]HPY58604.1 hypothetical protein [Bacteroidales bacterium]